MEDKMIIEKATKALKSLNLFTNNYTTIEVCKNNIEDALLLEAYPEINDTFTVDFSFNLPDGRKTGTAVVFDTKTYKLIRVITKSGIYKIPKELQ